MNKTTKNKGKTNNKNTRKRNIVIFIVVAAIILGSLYYHSNQNNKVLKNEYTMGEVGYIDDIEVTLKDATYINNGTGIEVTFEITNKRDNTITITPDDYFVFYDINKVQIPNKYTNDKNIIKKDEKITYKLQYDVTKKELYEIYFYSQVVENNIKFSFASRSINSDINESSVNNIE